MKHHVVELSNGKFSVDKLYFRNQERVFQTPFIETSNLHGTGCSFSSAITANIALGHTLENSIAIAKKFISEALKSAPDIGNGPGPINHKKSMKAPMNITNDVSVFKITVSAHAYLLFYTIILRLRVNS